MTDAAEATDTTDENAADPEPPASGENAAASAWADELAFTIEIARAAGAILVDRYDRLERIHHKSATDVVTEADQLSEELAIAAIRRRYPGDAILAEESGAHEGRASNPANAGDAEDAAGTARPPANGRTWVIDPLDGTVNYANGLPVFCVSIALVADGRPVAGVVLDPTRDELFAATAGGDATLNGTPIEASDKAKLSDCVVSMALAGRSVVRRVRAVRKAVRASRSMGSAALALAYVGNGRFDAFVQESGLSPWDIAAAGLIAERAGAVVTTFDGRYWYDGSIATRTANVVAAPAAHIERLRALARGET